MHINISTNIAQAFKETSSKS